MLDRKPEKQKDNEKKSDESVKEPSQNITAKKEKKLTTKEDEDDENLDKPEKKTKRVQKDSEDEESNTKKRLEKLLIVWKLTMDMEMANDVSNLPVLQPMPGKRKRMQFCYK